MSRRTYHLKQDRRLTKGQWRRQLLHDYSGRRLGQLKNNKFQFNNNNCEFNCDLSKGLN